MEAVTEHQEAKEISKVSLYRTKWLIAHDHLYKLVDDSSAKPAEVWPDYLRKLETAEDVAKKPA